MKKSIIILFLGLSLTSCSSDDFETIENCSVVVSKHIYNETFTRYYLIMDNKDSLIVDKIKYNNYKEGDTCCYQKLK